MNLPGTSATFSHITISATSRPYPLSQFRYLQSPHLISHSCLSTLQLPQQDHTTRTSPLFPFSRRSLLILANLRTFSLVLGTASHHPYVPDTSFIRALAPIYTHYVTHLYVHHQLLIRTFSTNPLKYSYKLFKGFV